MRDLVRTIATSGMLSMTILISGAVNAGPATDFFLGGVEDKAENLMAKARSEGNALAWGVADAAKSVIEAWKLANSDLLTKAFDELSAQQQELFNNMDETLSRLENDQALLVQDAEMLTAEWSGVIKNLPFVDDDPEVLNYRPRVVVPIGEAEVPLVVVGPKLSTAAPELKSGEKDIPVARTTDHELLAKLARSGLAFHETKSTYAQYKLTFDRSVSTWWQPWTWSSGERIEREATVWLLPKQMASFEIVPTMPTESVSTQIYSTQVGGKGKDSPYNVTVPLAPIWADQGYIYDTIEIAKQKFFSDAGGDNAQCVGAKIDSIKPQSFVFRIQLGHRTVGFSKKDAWVNCNLKLPIIRKVPGTMKGDVISGVLNWTDDNVQALPEGALDYTVTLRMFNGRSYVLTKETSDPTGVVQIQKTDKGILFRPKPPSDF